MGWRWTGRTNNDQEYLCLVGSLTLVSLLALPRLWLFQLRIARQLRRSDGLLGYALYWNLGSKTLWILSAWQSETDLSRFIYANPHGNAMVALRPLIEKSQFIRRTVYGSQLPISWKLVESWIHPL